jgi:flagellin-like protein
MFNKKAEMGIGTLILFIAMILVAAIAAGVLLTTAISLQSSALLTGKRTKTKVATQVEPILLYAEDGSSATVDRFYLKIMLSPGSQPIKFEEVLFAFDTKNTSNDYSFNNEIDCLNSSNLTNAAYSSNFGVEYLLSSTTDHQDDYLMRGEIAMICFKSARSIGEDEDLAFQIVPKVGNPVILDVTVPAVVNTNRVFLYP